MDRELALLNSKLIVRSKRLPSSILCEMDRTVASRICRGRHASYASLLCVTRHGDRLFVLQLKRIDGIQQLLLDWISIMFNAVLLVPGASPMSEGICANLRCFHLQQSLPFTGDTRVVCLHADLRWAVIESLSSQTPRRLIPFVLRKKLSRTTGKP